MATGTELDNTVLKRLEHIFQSICSRNVTVYNFAVVSSNTEQVCSLLWSRLFDLDPEMIVVVSGGTDAFQPYSFDPDLAFHTILSSQNFCMRITSIKITISPGDLALIMMLW